MKKLDPDLKELSDELDRLGYNVVPHGDHICIRLPLFSSVRVRLSNGRFRFAPQFGFLSRTAGMLVTSAVTAAVVGGVAFGFGELAPTLFVGFVSMIALAHDACRFIVTEGALTRLQQIVGPGRLLGSGSPAKQSFLTKSQQTRG